MKTEKFNIGDVAMGVDYGKNTSSGKVTQIDYNTKPPIKSIIREKIEEARIMEMELVNREKYDKNGKPKVMEHGVNAYILKCQKCNLCKTKKNYIVGKGNPSAEILFVGEAPGKDEDEQGKPFVGSAGIILDMLLEEADFKENDYYITNILKCRPPNNRNPEKAEIRACFEHLIKEIDVIRPDYIVCLGNYAVWTLFNYFNVVNKLSKSISKIHGELFIGTNPKHHTDDINFRKVNLIPMYHPAVGLYKPELRATMLADMNRLYYYYMTNRKNKELLPF